MIPSIAPGRVTPRISKIIKMAKGNVAVKYAACEEKERPSS